MLRKIETSDKYECSLAITDVDQSSLIVFEDIILLRFVEILSTMENDVN